MVLIIRYKETAMDTELLKTVGEIGGIGGIALGILLLFFS
jgi:hypothetical protein